MRGEKLDIQSIVADAELRHVLQEELCRFFGRRLEIVKLDRRISQYCSSFIIEELDVTLDGGMTLQLVFKDLSKAALLTGAEKFKPAFLFNSLREIETYRKVLSQHQLGTAECFGAFVDTDTRRYWLFLERMQPVLLWQMGSIEVWNEVARWLAGIHTYLVRETEIRESRHLAHLLNYDGKFYSRWIDRAVRFIHEGDTTPGRKATASIKWLAKRYDRVIERMLSLPVTVIHGEFFASNILLDVEPEHFRICPVDWEMAAVAPGYVDLAGLTSGSWTRPQKDEMARAYYEALPDDSPARCGLKEFLANLECARLYQAIQWLGWAPGWAPPPEHAQDWLKEALRCARHLGL